MDSDIETRPKSPASVAITTSCRILHCKGGIRVQTFRAARYHQNSEGTFSAAAAPASSGLTRHELKTSTVVIDAVKILTEGSM